MLKDILENLLLSEDTQKQLVEAFETAIAAKEAELEISYKEKEETIQEETIAKVQELVEEALSEELEALSEELEHARTLDVQYAQKLEEFKESFTATKEDQVQVLVAEMVEEELETLKEGISLAKKNEFGMKIYESMHDAYVANFGGIDLDVVEKLKEVELQLESYQRNEKITSLLEGIGGKERGVLVTLLENCATDKLEDRFNAVKSIVLSDKTPAEPEVISESQIVQEPEKIDGEPVLVLESENDKAVLAAFQRALQVAKG